MKYLIDLVFLQSHAAFHRDGYFNFEQGTYRTKYVSSLDVVCNFYKYTPYDNLTFVFLIFNCPQFSTPTNVFRASSLRAQISTVCILINSYHCSGTNKTIYSSRKTDCVRFFHNSLNNLFYPFSTSYILIIHHNNHIKYSSCGKSIRHNAKNQVNRAFKTKMHQHKIH